MQTAVVDMDTKNLFVEILRAILFHRGFANDKRLWFLEDHLPSLFSQS